MAGGNRNGRGGKAKKVALGGIFSALAVIILLAGGLIPVGTFAAPIFAGICLMPVAIDVGVRWALLCYVVVSALSALMVPDTELILFFIILFGYYPILHPTLQKIKSRVLRWVLKLAIFNCAVIAVYSILLFVLVSPAVLAEFAEEPSWLWAVLLVFGNFTFVLYDVLLSRMRPIYIQRIQRYFRR